MNSTNRVTDVKDRKAPLRLNEIFDARFEQPTDHLKDTEVLPDLPDYSPEEEPFSFAVLPSLETTPAALPPADTVSGTPPAPKAASAPPGPAHVSPGSKVPGRVASSPFFASGPPLPTTAPFVTIATPVPASASSCTTAPLALKFSPTNNKSIFASSVGSSISIGPAGTGRRFSLRHIGLSETESKHIGEVAHAMPPVTPPKPLPPRSSVPRASGLMYRDHANKTPYSRGHVPFRNASMSSSSSKSRASQQGARSLSASAHLLASSPDMITESVVVSDSLVANILALYHVNKMMFDFDVTICLRYLTFAVSGKIYAVKSAVQELGALEVQVKGSLVKQSYPLECHYLPVFNEDLAIKIAAEIEKPFCVQIEVATRSGILSLGEFCKAMEGVFSSKEATPANNLRDYLTTPYSHRWCEVVAGAQKEHDLPDDLNEALNLSYAPGKVVQVSYSGSELSVDFLKMTITVEQSHTNIKVAPSWWYRMDDNFGEVKLDKALSEAIEAFILYGMPVVVDGKSYSVDLEKMKLTDKQSMEETLIKRDPQIGRLYTPALVVFLVSGLKEDVSKVSCKLQTLLNAQTVKKDLPLTGPETIKNIVFSLARQYCVKISREKEKLVLESSPEYIEKVKSPIQSQYLELLVKSTTLPPHWDEMEGRIEIKPVPASSTEFTKVLSLMKKTLLSAQIVKLERIQNQWLWEKYAFAKKRMEEKNGQEVNEKELFHGTRDTPPEKVYGSEQGFDFRFAADGMWGAGAYFAVNASYSDRYAYHTNSNQKQMLLASVLTGESIECPSDKNLKKPPLKKAEKGSTFKDERYDSVTGTTHGSRIYVVYDHEKTYPSYLITYK